MKRAVADEAASGLTTVNFSLTNTAATTQPIATLQNWALLLLVFVLLTIGVTDMSRRLRIGPT